MIWILVFVIFYMAASAWDIGRVNALYAKLAKPGPSKPSVVLPPAPRLVINLPPKTMPNEGRPLSS